MTEQFPNDELQALWANQPEQLTITNMKELTMSLEQQHRKEQKRLLFLNFQEVIPAVGMFLWAGWQGLQATERSWAWFAAALISLAVGVYLASSSLQQRRVEQSFDDTTRGQLEKARSQMQHRARLYRNVAWWYLVPVLVTIGFMLVATGVDLTTTASLGFFAVTAALFGVLYRWNRKIGRDNYEPQVQRLSGLIADLNAS